VCYSPPELAPLLQNRKWWWYSRAMKTHILYTIGNSTKRRTQWDKEFTKWLSSLGEKLKEKFSIQKWNRAIRAIIDQIDTSNTFSMVTKDCLRAWLNFKRFKLVRPRTHKSGPKSSWSNFITEHSIDWINIVDQFLESIRCCYT
jgi:hypothetical protein